MRDLPWATHLAFYPEQPFGDDRDCGPQPAQDGNWLAFCGSSPVSGVCSRGCIRRDGGDVPQSLTGTLIVRSGTKGSDSRLVNRKNDLRKFRSMGACLTLNRVWIRSPDGSNSTRLERTCRVAPSDAWDFLVIAEAALRAATSGSRASGKRMTWSRARRQRDRIGRRDAGPHHRSAFRSCMYGIAHWLE